MKPKLKNILSSQKTITSCVWIFRVLVGLVFIFSGWAKVDDLWGTVYKIEEYFYIWDISVTRETVVAMSFLLAATEFTSGLMLILGCFRRVVTWVIMAIMTVMTPLTLYIFMENPVADCGCFGDALILSNGATFFKNIVLTGLVIYLIKYNKECRSLYTPRIQWLAVVAAVAYAAVIGMVGYSIQPLVDFRPYPVGTSLIRNSENASNNDEMVFVYEKDGETQEFSVDNLPDDSWTFVERKFGPIEATSDLAIFEEDYDVATEVIATSGPQVMLIVSDPGRYGISRSRMANSINSYIEKRGGTMICVVAGDENIEDAWSQQVGADYQVYSADDTELKALARGDAALIYLKDGIIKWKRNIYSLSPHFPVNSNNLSENAFDEIQPIESGWNVTKITGLFVIIMLLISTLNIIPVIKRKAQKQSGGTSKETMSSEEEQTLPREEKDSDKA